MATSALVLEPIKIEDESERNSLRQMFSISPNSVQQAKEKNDQIAVMTKNFSHS